MEGKRTERETALPHIRERVLRLRLSDNVKLSVVRCAHAARGRVWRRFFHSHLLMRDRLWFSFGKKHAGVDSVVCKRLVPRRLYMLTKCLAQKPDPSPLPCRRRCSTPPCESTAAATLPWPAGQSQSTGIMGKEHMSADRGYRAARGAGKGRVATHLVRPLKHAHAE